MLTRTTGRRTASALLAALVTIALVTVGAPARGASAGVSADSSHAHVAAKYVRTTQAVAPEHVEHVRVHVDLALTPLPADGEPRETVEDATPAPAVIHSMREPVAEVGRGPPTP